MTPLEPFRRSIRGCISTTGTPDEFLDDPMNAVIAVASPLVPALACIVDPPIIPPPIPPIETELVPIIPFITPSDASLIKAVNMPEELVIPIAWAYCDIAAMDIP
jgi:hypothetical protein